MGVARAVLPDVPHAPRRYLRCNCCGGEAGRFVQHWNQDTGWGICRDCLERYYIGKGHDAGGVLSIFGVEGVNYASAEQWKRLKAKEAAAWAKWKRENGIGVVQPEGGAS